MISVKNLTKMYKVNKDVVNAVNGISFDIANNEIVGFIGPNGAGKTTTLRIMTGILYPTSGMVTVNDMIPWKQRVEYVRNIGVLFGNRPQLWPELTLNQSLKILKNIYQIPNKTFTQNYKSLTELMDVGDFIYRPIRKMSLGQRMRCEMVSCLIHGPNVLFLDEPTIGLDVRSKEAFKLLIKHINRTSDTTIIFTSHDLHEVDSICNRLIVINDGNIIADGKNDCIKEKFGQGKTLKITNFNQEILEKLNSIIDIESSCSVTDYLNQGEIELVVKPDTNLAAVLYELSMHQEVNFELKESDLSTAILKVLEEN